MVLTPDLGRYRRALTHLYETMNYSAARADGGDGVILLTDMFGGTPSNLALAALSRQGVEVIAGVNLPMLIKLASVRDQQPLAEAVAAAQEAGRKYINIASQLLAQDGP